jgi:hypothetical protein
MNPEATPPEDYARYFSLGETLRYGRTSIDRGINLGVFTIQYIPSIIDRNKYKRRNGTLLPTLLCRHFKVGRDGFVFVPYPNSKFGITIVPVDEGIGCSEDTDRLAVMVNVPKHNSQKVQDGQFPFQQKGLSEKEPRQHFGPGIEEFKHVDFNAFMVSTPYID